LVVLYQELRERCRASGGGGFGSGTGTCAISPEQLAIACHRRDAHCELDERGVKNGLAIFEELGLLRSLGHDDGYPENTVQLLSSQRIELSASSIYLEGREECALFERFREWAFDASVDELREQVIGPLAPSEYGYVSKHA
jgi:hypothetical protein